MEYVTIVIMLALTQYVWFSIQVGRARGRFEVQVPATSGNDDFERYFRAHQNTTERLVVFLPAIFACGYFVNSLFVALMRLVFIIGRGLCFRGYTEPQKSRTAGFTIGDSANTLITLSTSFVTKTSLLWHVPAEH